MTTLLRRDNTQPGVGTDMPDARPRSRMRLAPGRTETAVVEIDDDGKATIPEGVEVDTYAGAKYKDVRDEGVATWARRDGSKKPKKEK